jgi:hypothetical protein
MNATFARKRKRVFAGETRVGLERRFRKRSCYCVLVCVLFPGGTMRLNALVSRSVEDMVALIYIST